MDGDLQLFGAAAAAVGECTLTVRPPRNGQLGSVYIEASEPMHRTPMSLLVQSLSAEQMATSVGVLVPIILGAHWKSTPALKRHFWAAFRQLGIAGREVAIKGCGKQPK